ncbi:hypothetical protein RBSWK_05566 [Rhodopirellula baltica SWK14]|uniref:Transmembrane protein n=1 Tax=Rhodopirellula baltica SWK14 TaxID=993516 RepID=L7C9N9_RHOBT|nr:hypothetical protein RBSWK_05566 [Rhodopirellula baltica SWK14]
MRGTIACTGVRESAGFQIENLSRVPGDACRSLNREAITLRREFLENPYIPPDGERTDDRSFVFRVDLLIASFITLAILAVASDGCRKMPLLHLFLIPIPLCLITFYKAIATLPTWVSARTDAIETYVTGWVVLLILGAITCCLEWWSDWN